MDLLISQTLLKQLKSPKRTLLKNIKEVSGLTFTPVQFYNRMVDRLNNKYPQFRLQHINSLDEVKAEQNHFYMARIKDHGHVIADIVIANANKAGNTFISQQLMSFLIDTIYSDRDYLTNDVIKVVYSTYDREPTYKNKDVLPNSMTMVLRSVQTIGFDVVEMFPNKRALPGPFLYVEELLKNYNAGRNDANKSSQLEITSEKLPSDTLTLSIKAKNALGSTEYYYQMLLLAIYRLNGPMLKYDFNTDKLSENSEKFLDIFNNRPTIDDSSESTSTSSDDNDGAADDVLYTIPQGKGKNEIHYGAPGTGKSYSVSEQYQSNPKTMQRITFYPDYDYSDFVGGLQPTRENGTIDYLYVGGPLVWSIIRALDNPTQEITLIIEEINRAEAASVFGDTFQLLDRDSVTGISTYAISNVEMANFIDDHTKFNYDLSHQGIRLPGNLNIIATMNPADQGVYPLDTAFKRRWHMQYHPINWKYSPSNKYPNIIVPGFNEQWQAVGQAINIMLMKLGTNEDSLLGQFFFDTNELSGSNNVNYVSSKLFGYLWNDVARYKREELFKAHTLSQLIDDYKHCCEVHSSTKDTMNKLFVDSVLPVMDGSNED